MTIYLPDDLADLVKAHDDLNVSAVCQDALRRELSRREHLAALGKGMERIELYLGEDGDQHVAFTGKEVYCDDEQAVMAYVTRRHRIAVFFAPHGELTQYDTFADLADDVHDAELLTSVAAALGVDHVIELDI